MGDDDVGGLPVYEGLQVYDGDLHGHCAVGYGRGSAEDAYQNARLQLEFSSVTAHACWHGNPGDESRLEGVVAYHQEGFERAARSCSDLQDPTEAAHRDGEFVTFLCFEWHSMRHEDHNGYFKGATGDIIPAYSLEEMRAHLRRLAGQGADCFLVPITSAIGAGAEASSGRSSPLSSLPWSRPFPRTAWPSGLTDPFPT